jgi:hypothetical protein
MNFLVTRISRFISITSLIAMSCLTQADVIFTENFDEQGNWHSGLEINDDGGLHPVVTQDRPLDGADVQQMRKDGYTLPNGWDAARQFPLWAESYGNTGFPENVEILAANADKAKGGTGKSLVVYRQSAGGLAYQFPSDGQLDKELETPTDEVFVSFNIRFSDNWTPIDTVATVGGATKLFRVSSIDAGGDPFSAFSIGDSSAIFVWTYKHSENTGLRNDYTFRADPQETNYSMNNPPLSNVPTSSNSINYVGHIRDLDGDGIDDNTVTLLSLTKGTPVGSDGQTVLHDEIWGNGTWRKMQFYLKMNSAPGALDGQLRVWMDDQLIFKNVTVPWQGNDAPGGLKWTHVGFGGNASFKAYDASEQRTEWRAYDDVVVRTSIPEELLSGSPSIPNPPTSITVE